MTKVTFKIGPPHKHPYYEKPVRSAFYTACCAGLKVDPSLQFFRTIKSKHFTPLFKRHEIDKLFTEEVLKTYGEGRYLYKEKLDSIENWGDLINNIVYNCLLSRDRLKTSKRSSINKRIERVKEFQVNLRKLKIIEDWLYYHPEALEKIISDGTKAGKEK